MPDPAHPVSTPRTVLAFGTCTLIWGSTFLAISIGNDTVPPMWAATLRLLIAALVLLAIERLRGRALPRGAALRAATGYGLFQFGFNLPLLYWGETRVPSGLAAVVFATIPITSALIATAFRIERLEPLKLGGAAVAIAGVAIMFGRELSASVTAWPVLAIWLATVSAALGSTLLKRGPRQDPLGANAIACCVGTPMCLLASFLLREPQRLPTEWVQIYPILYLAIAGSVVAFVVFAWLVNHWKVSSIAFIGVVVPLIAMALGVLVRHEPVRRAHLTGALVVLAGLGLAIASDRRRLAAATARPAGASR